MRESDLNETVKRKNKSNNNSVHSGSWQASITVHRFKTHLPDGLSDTLNAGSGQTVTEITIY